MKVVLTRAEAKRYLSHALRSAILPGRAMNVVSCQWNRYEEEITVELEPIDEDASQPESSVGQLASSPSPAPSSPDRNPDDDIPF